MSSVVYFIIDKINMAPNQRSVLVALEDICNVDVDAVDPKVSTAMPFKPHNRMNALKITLQNIADIGLSE